MSARLASLLALAGLLAGCSQMQGMATRYRAERMIWEAQRRETQLRVGKAAPDSATLLRIRAEYQKLRQTFRAPFLEGSGTQTEKLRRDIARQVGLAELTAARTALFAHRPDLALESSRWVASIAGADSSLAREADLASVMALRAQRRFDEAIAIMRGMLDRYPPATPRSPEQEDPILNVPDAIVELRGETADSSLVNQDRAYAVAYFRKLLAAHPTPLLEAQVRARLSRTLLEMGQAEAAFAEVGALRALVQQTPALRSLEPELLYTEARIRGMQKDYRSALTLYDSVVKAHSSSPFAARSLLDAAVISERMGDPNAAVTRYRALLDRRNVDPAIAPVASYRMAMVKDQMGQWEEAKEILEGIPTQYPKSRAGVEAPFAIVEHYYRSRQPDAAKAALVKAIETYRTMIRMDTVSAYATVYRWNTLRAYTALERWKEALATVDEMAENDRGAPITAEALFQGAQIARANGDKVKSDVYLQRIVLEYPKSPRAAAVRNYLQQNAAKTPKR
ncbi:MAG TPA: tetratricopeptide repeat protein [Candidatus Polarisedimenticolia bacterium]|nr:tetratricopeptide repeat protein [Candidatus Polarisedimenticolia bacterium]